EKTPSLPAPPPWCSRVMSATAVARSDVSLIMRATLHQGASSTYFGHWPALIPKEWGRKVRSIAQNALAERAGSGAVQTGDRDSLGNRIAVGQKFILCPKDKRARHHLTLRSERSERLEGWHEYLVCCPPFETHVSGVLLRVR